MFIDDSNKVRTSLLKIIETPNNSEVVYYNTKFVDLINVDVDRLYADELSKYCELEEQCERTNKKITEYNERLKQLDESKKKLTEQEHINKIQALEIEYTQKYKDVKTLEHKLDIYKGKLTNIDNKIEIQKAKELKQLANKKQSVFSQKEKIKTSIANIKTLLELNEKVARFVAEKLETYQKKYFYTDKYGEAIKNGTFVCEYCKGHIHSKKTKDTLLEENEANKQNILVELEKVTKEAEKNAYEKIKLQCDLSNLRAELKNLEQIDSQDLFTYEKKSMEVLKLEASKFRIQEEMYEIEELYNERMAFYGNKLFKLRQDLTSYKESLNNLREINEAKKTAKTDIENYQKDLDQLKRLKANLLLHCDFLMIRNKIIEKKLNELFDLKLKFELFEQQDIRIKPKTVIYYNNIELRHLSPEEQKEVNKMICDKISLLS